ncbi:protein of unknown function [Shewanella benthica]|uniref:Uncharacterized protein n=1 Tax=Shewanella benthica TaxID=43661 RepID=A0A330M4K1_9GAMM|nr:protein of unknown function [Shewanella benthica]
MITVDGTVAGSLTVKDVTDYATFAHSFTERCVHGKAITVDGTFAGSLTVKDITDYATFAHSFTERCAYGKRLLNGPTATKRNMLLSVFP